MLKQPIHSQEAIKEFISNYGDHTISDSKGISFTTSVEHGDKYNAHPVTRDPEGKTFDTQGFEDFTPALFQLTTGLEDLIGSLLTELAVQVCTIGDDESSMSANDSDYTGLRLVTEDEKSKGELDFITTDVDAIQKILVSIGVSMVGQSSASSDNILRTVLIPLTYEDDQKFFEGRAGVPEPTEEEKEESTNF